MIYRARLYWLINCLNGREWLWPAGHGSTGYFSLWTVATFELSQPGKPACFRRWQVCLSVCFSLFLSLCLSLCLSLSLSIYIYIYIYMCVYIIYIIYILYRMQNLG